jgi:poly(A) polymerase Pap1
VDLCLTSFETLLSRQEFFDDVTPFLRSEKVGATFVHDVREAFIPLIRFEFRGVKFDLVYVAMNRPTEYNQKLLKDYLLDEIHIAPDRLSFNSAQGYLQS